AAALRDRAVQDPGAEVGVAAEHGAAGPRAEVCDFHVDRAGCVLWWEDLHLGGCRWDVRKRAEIVEHDIDDRAVAVSDLWESGAFDHNRDATRGGALVGSDAGDRDARCCGRHRRDEQRRPEKREEHEERPSIEAERMLHARNVAHAARGYKANAK